MTTVAVAHADLAGGTMDILENWAVESENYARELGYAVIDISGPDLTYERMAEILMQTKPAVLFNFSYGSKECLMGNPVDGTVKCTLTRGDGMPNNLKAVAGTAVVAYSSHATDQLGRDMVKYGCPSVAGFSDDLMIVSDETESQNIFKECLLPLAKRILDGWTVGAAVEATRSDLSTAVKKYKKFKFISLPLFYNRKYLTQLGDPNWKMKNG